MDKTLDNASASAKDRWTYRGYTLDPGNFTTAMVHLYRAEAAKANLWRSRLDTTTNWAVVTVGAALTFSFSSNQNPHFVLILVLFLVLTFLWIEARRYRYYGLWYHRVRILETDFFASMVAPPFEPPGDWGEALSASLLEPIFFVPTWRAIAIRYRRNYIWLISLILLSWFLKLSIHPTPASNVRDFIEHAGINGVIPGGWTFIIILSVYGAMGVLTLVSLVIRRRFGDEACRPKGYRRDPRITALDQNERLAIIITNLREAVAQGLIDKLKRGVTALEGTGMYTGEARAVLLCAFEGDQVQLLRKIVNQVDPDAFVILTDASDPRGYQFAPEEPPS
jgi:uncharacterized membrane protein